MKQTPKHSIRRLLYLASALVVAPCYAQAQEATTPTTEREFFVRGSFAGPSVLRGLDRSVKSRAKNPFVLSYERDEIAPKEAFALKGSLFGQIRRTHSTEQSLRLSAFSLGLDIDQSDVDGANARDTLALKAGSAWLWQFDDAPFWKSHYLSTNIGWITDRDLDLSVATLDFQYTPTGSSYGLAGTFYEVGNFRYMLTPAITAEYQKVIDAAGRAEYMGQSERLYLGASLEAVGGFHKGPLQPLTINAKYGFAQDILGSAPNHDLIELGLNWALTKEGHVSLQTKYTKGSTPSQQEADKVTVGLGISF